jgi:hypothetical protein
MTFFRQTLSPLDDIKQTFSFLTTEFGFKLTYTLHDENYIGEYIAIYRNDNSKLQLEISANNNYFHCEILRLLSGQPAKYSDPNNCIGFEDLVILESNHNYDHSAYYASGQLGLKGVLNNTAKLFKRNKAFLTTNCWVDIKKIQQLKDNDFLKKFGFIPNRDQRTYFTEIKKQAGQFLTEKGFQIFLDSDELPPYDSRSLTKNIIFKKDKIEIKVSAWDWRDSYFIFYIKVNDKKIFEIDLAKNPDLDINVEQTMQELRKWAERNSN